MKGQRRKNVYLEASLFRKERYGEGGLQDYIATHRYSWSCILLEKNSEKPVPAVRGKRFVQIIHYGLSIIAPA